MVSPERKNWKKIFAAATAWLSVVCTAVAAGALEIKIAVPSEGQREIAETRDFYVVGSLKRNAADPSFDIRVNVYSVIGKRRELVRSLASSTDVRGVTPDEAVSWDLYASPSASADILAAPPPDIVFDPSQAESMSDPRNKVVVRRHYFAALVLGGASSLQERRDTRIDYGIASASGDLSSGKYLIEVNAVTKAGKKIAETSFDLKADIVSRKLAARFSPPRHVEASQTFAKSLDIRVYTDPFPGYWSTETMRGAVGDSAPDVFFEIPGRWRPNDAVEYEAGQVDVILYNISERCTTQRIELGMLAHAERLGTPGVRCWYYDIGEPALRMDRLIAPGRAVVLGGGQGLALEGRLKELAPSDMLALTRMEIAPASSARNGDNVWKESRNARTVALLDGTRSEVNGTVLKDVVPGGSIRVCGVVRPLPSAAVKSTDMGYDIASRIRHVSVSLQLKDENGRVRELAPAKKIPVSLDRFYGDAERASNSIYEFIAEFIVPKTIPPNGASLIVSAEATVK